MVNFKRVVLNDFISFEKEVFDFKQGNYLVLGDNKDSSIASSNGAGKSALFDSVVFALYGKIDRNPVRKQGKECFVVLEFEYKGDEYRIVRYARHPVLKNKVEVFKNGKRLGYKANRQVDSFIREIVGLDYGNFTTAVVYRQGMTVRISTLTPAQRKSYFSCLVDVNFDKVATRVKKDLEVVQVSYDSVKREFEKVERQIAELEGRIGELEKLYSELDTAKLESRQKELIMRINELRKRKEELETEFNRLEHERQRKREEYMQRKGELQKEVNQLTRLVKGNGKCPLCGSVISDIEEKKQLLKQKTKELFEPFVFDDSKIKELRTQIDLLSSELAKFESELYHIGSKLKESKGLKERLEKLRKGYETERARADRLVDKVVEAEAELNRLSEFYSLVRPSGELRTILLLAYFDIYNSILSSIIEIVFPEVKGVVLQADDKLSGLVLKGIEYADLSGGEKRRLDFALQLAFGEFLSALGNVDFNIRVFDEVFDSLDSDSVVQILSSLQDLFFGKAVYFVTHNNELKSLFKDIIIVRKENGISKVVKE